MQSQYFGLLSLHAGQWNAFISNGWLCNIRNYGNSSRLNTIVELVKKLDMKSTGRL